MSGEIIAAVLWFVLGMGVVPVIIVLIGGAIATAVRGGVDTKGALIVFVAWIVGVAVEVYALIQVIIHVVAIIQLIVAGS